MVDEELTARVAEHALSRDMESESWQKAVAIRGLLAAGEPRFEEAAVELFADSLYMVCPFFVRYGEVTGEEGPTEDAVNQFRVHERRLRSGTTGLFRHVWSESPDDFQGAYWSRGNGWVLAALVDALSHLPAGHPDRGYLTDLLSGLAGSVLGYQEGNGLWHEVLDDPDSSPETSGTLMFAYAFARAADRGLLGERYRRAAERALSVCAGAVDGRGAVRRVSTPPGGPGAPLSTTSYGQGWFLLAAAAL